MFSFGGRGSVLFYILKRVPPLKKNHIEIASQDFMFIMSQWFLCPVRSASVLQTKKDVLCQLRRYAVVLTEVLTHSSCALSTQGVLLFLYLTINNNFGSQNMPCVTLGELHCLAGVCLPRLATPVLPGEGIFGSGRIHLSCTPLLLGTQWAQSCS